MVEAKVEIDVQIEWGLGNAFLFVIRVDEVLIQSLFRDFKCIRAQKGPKQNIQF